MNKKAVKQKAKIEETLANLRGIVRHIRNVQENCILMGEKLIESGDIELGKNLIANGMKHDNSKFHGIEYEYMAPLYASQGSSEDTKKMKLKMAITHHAQTNNHHPEAWENIHTMPEVFIAEMVCDWKSRSEEFGASLQDYIQNQAMKRFIFDENDKVYKQIMKFVKSC